MSVPLSPHSSPNRSIIGPLSLVNVASDTSDGSFMHAARVSRKVGGRGGCVETMGGWVMVEGGEANAGVALRSLVLFFLADQSERGQL